MDLSTFYVFQFIAVIILIDVQSVPCLVSGDFFKLALEFFNKIDLLHCKMSLNPAFVCVMQIPFLKYYSFENSTDEK